LFQYKINKKLNAAARAEYYNDPHAIIITAFPATGLKVSSYSFNFDFIPSSWLRLRTEVKYMDSAADVFDRNGQGVNKNLSLLLSLAAAF
jgi:Putative beta-barrel porin-2, OmpL-like. bbp2